MLRPVERPRNISLRISASLIPSLDSKSRGEAPGTVVARARAPAGRETVASKPEKRLTESTNSRGSVTDTDIVPRLVPPRTSGAVAAAMPPDRPRCAAIRRSADRALTAASSCRAMAVRSPEAMAASDLPFSLWSLSAIQSRPLKLIRSPCPKPGYAATMGLLAGCGR